jgi:tripartite-type tricarboxylate transporter receptor subunit TctC
MGKPHLNRCALRATARAALGTFAAATAIAAAAQSYPSRPITILNPITPGSALELNARTYINPLSERLGQPVVLEFRPGATGMVGMAATARAKPDGYTMVIVASAYFAFSPHMGKVPYDPLKDFSPIVITAANYQAIAVNPSVPANTLAELVALARQKPGSVAFATTGPGSSSDVLAAILEKQAGAQFLRVPYKGASDMIAAVLGGQAQATQVATILLPQQAQAGKLRIIGVTGPNKVDSMPNVPTTVADFPSSDMSGWFGLVGPAGMPRDIVNRLNREIVAITRTPEVGRFYAQNDWGVVASTPEEMGARINSEYERFGKIFKDIGIKAE